MKLTIAALSLLLVLSALNCSFAFEKAEELAWKCANEGNNPKQIVDAIECARYIGGVIDTSVVISGAYPAVNLFCLPKDGISADQARNVFIKWVKSHPESQHKSATFGVLMSLKEAFPCRDR